MAKKTVVSLGEIIGNQYLAADVGYSVEIALKQSHIHILGSTVKRVFQNALEAAIRDIKEHPKGKLFQRFIEHGPLDSGQPAVEISDSQTTLSDVECGNCIEFIHSHMVNRFKGELAELLAIEPCVLLLHRLVEQRLLPDDTHLYLGDMIQERRNIRGKWGGFTKGADGLLVRQKNTTNDDLLELYGVVVTCPRM